MTIPARDSAYRYAGSALDPFPLAYGSAPGTTGFQTEPELRMLPAAFHRFRLPSIDGARPTVVRNWHRAGRSTGRQHIVVVDYDPRLLEVLGNLLDDEGYDVTLSPQFLDEVDTRRLRADIVIADASFNRGPDGLHLYSDPLMSRHGTAITVITSTTMPRVAADIFAAGVPTLLKPFDLDDLLELLALVCPRR